MDLPPRLALAGGLRTQIVGMCLWAAWGARLDIPPWRPQRKTVAWTGRFHDALEKEGTYQGKFFEDGPKWFAGEFSTDPAFEF